MTEGRLWKFKIAKAGDPIAPYFLPRFSLESDLLYEKLHHFPDGISWGDLAVDPRDAELRLDGVEIPPRDLDLNGGDVPTLMPGEPRFLLIIDPLLHGDLNVEFGLRLILLQLHGVLRLQNLKDLILILLASTLKGQVTVHPSPFLILLLHLLSTFLIVIHIIY